MYTVFDPQFLVHITPKILYCRMSARFAFYDILPFCKVWLCSVCWPPSAKPGNEVECRFFGKCVKTPVPEAGKVDAKYHWSVWSIGGHQAQRRRR